MTVGEIPTTCTCGTEMVGIQEYVGDFWGAPAYETQGQQCPECGSTDEYICENHDPATCDIEDCAWCAFIKTEVEE